MPQAKLAGTRCHTTTEPLRRIRAGGAVSSTWLPFFPGASPVCRPQRRPVSNTYRLTGVWVAGLQRWQAVRADAVRRLSRSCLENERTLSEWTHAAQFVTTIACLDHDELHLKGDQA